jgi:anti-sigma factor RsiW
MNHEKFKAHQTAAAYVAGGLDESDCEEFELHMIGCPACVEEVEVWRAIKLEMPRTCPEGRASVPRRRYAAFSDWRMAASLVGTGLLGAAGGWMGKASTATDLDSTRTVVFNLPAVSRGADDCTNVRLAPDTQLAIVRVPGLSHDGRVVALDSDKRALPAGQYTTRIQPDASHLLQLKSKQLLASSVYLESQDAHGNSSPLGCLRGRLRGDAR